MNTPLNLGFVVQMWHLEFPDKKAAAGYCLEADLEPYSQGLHDTHRSTLRGRSENLVLHLCPGKPLILNVTLFALCSTSISD